MQLINANLVMILAKSSHFQGAASQRGVIGTLKHGVLATHVVKLLSLLIVFLLCCSKPPKLRNLPEGFVNLLKQASTTENIFKLGNTITLQTPDTVLVGDINYLHFTEDGRFAIIDRANRAVLVFDTTGRFLGRIGRGVGAGPGEFRGASAVCYDDSSKNWYVADNALLKVSVFDNSRDYMREFRIAFKVTQLLMNKGGDLYLFMPGAMEEGMLECLNSRGEMIAKFFSHKLPLGGIYGGGICLSDTLICAAHYMSSEMSCFDYWGKPKFTCNLTDLKSYVPPDPSKVRDLEVFFSSFTGVINLLSGPFNVVVIQYGRLAGGKYSERYLGFVTNNGEVLASGIKASYGYFASDFYGNLYTIEYPDLSAAPKANPMLKKWILRSF